MAPKSKTFCIKCVKLLKTSRDDLFCSRCENSLHLKCPRQSPKEFSKYQKRKKQNLFANFALNTLVLNVTGMPSMVRKDSHVLVVIFRYMTNMQELPRLNIKAMETTRRNLAIADLVKSTCFLFMALVMTSSIVL